MTLPLGVVSTISTAPADLAGRVITTDVEVIVPRVAAVPPTVTFVVPARFVPVIVEVMPPMRGPETTESEVIVGPPAKVNLSAAEVTEVPPGVVT